MYETPLKSGHLHSHCKIQLGWNRYRSYTYAHTIYVPSCDYLLPPPPYSGLIPSLLSGMSGLGMGVTWEWSGNGNGNGAWELSLGMRMVWEWEWSGNENGLGIRLVWSGLGMGCMYMWVQQQRWVWGGQLMHQLSWQPFGSRIAWSYMPAKQCTERTDSLAISHFVLQSKVLENWQLGYKPLCPTKQSTRELTAWQWHYCILQR